MLLSQDVASDSASMVSAINTGNSVGTLYSIYLKDSTYTLTTAHNSDWDGGNELPVITGDITIVGNGAIIERASGSLPFRIFKVDDGGRLVLDGVTICGGDADDQTGGGIRNLGTPGRSITP